MKTSSFLFSSIILLSFITIEIRKQQYDNGQVKYKVEIEKGMFNGTYTSWYKNGKKKAEGLFKNNQRIGKWTVYDSLGQPRMVRNYENLFQFTTVSAKNEKGENVNLPEKETYKLIRNKNGYYEYPQLLEKDIVVTKRIWRTIEPNSENNYFFNKNKLFDIIAKNITTNKLTAYDIESDEFKKELNAQQVQEKISKGTFDVIGYKIKEDWYFNSSWQISETRIIGICPVIREISNGKQTDLFWIYYPELRPILGSEKIVFNGDNLISTLDDLFQFRNFNSSIYKESNIYDRKLSDYKSGKEINEEAEKIEMGILDLEHDIWLNMTTRQ